MTRRIPATWPGLPLSWLIDLAVWALRLRTIARKAAQ